jgi:TRAP-type uncharacterized transport system fused permease subunit
VFYNSNILFSILFIVLIILILGTALNTTTTYLISVVFFAPIFLKQGYDLLPTHLFILYYSALGSITPPVALTSLTAASIANASFMKVSVKAMSLSSVMYFIPVLILINPMILHPVLSVEFGVMLLRILLGMYLLVYATEDNSFNEKYRIIIKGFLFFAGAAIIVLDMNFTLTIVLGLMALSINQFTRKEVFK